MNTPALRLPRFPEVLECTWTEREKCRFAECRFSLLGDRPRIKEWDPEDLEALIAALPSTCSLDLASLGPMLLDEIATFLGLPRPLVEQTELQATRKLGRLRELRRAHWDSY